MYTNNFKINGHNRYDQILSIFEEYRNQKFVPPCASIDGGYALLQINKRMMIERINSDYPDFEPCFDNDFDEGDEIILLGFLTDSDLREIMINEWMKWYNG